MVLTDMLIGDNVKIVHSSDRSQVSMIGIVIDETRNTLKIKEQNGRELTIPKKEISLEIERNHNKITVSGLEIQGTVAERIYKF
jgi:RNase P/RNase MRP subunit p29